jgi:uncharacterized protein (DUF1330 family)
MAYKIVIGLHVTDDAQYQCYREAMEPILSSVGGAFGYDFMIAEVLRSRTDEQINRVFTIEFPDKGVMDSFFSRPDYQEIKKQYFAGSVESTTVISMGEDGE